MKASIKKTVILVICATLAALILLAASYLLYVVCSYHRVEDHLPLSIEGDAKEAIPVESELTLLTYNIGFGAYGPDYSFFMDGGKYSRAFSKESVLEHTAGALQTVKNENPALILFQEVDIDGTRSHHVDQSALLADGLSGYDRVFAENYDSPYFIYPITSPIGANRSGMMTFSAYHIESAVRRSLPIEDSLYKYLDLDRAYSRAVIPAENGKTLVLYNVHLSAYTSDGTIADEQMKMLGKDMAADYAAGNYVIAAGDFNKDMLGDSSQYFERIDGEFTWAKPFDASLLPEGFSAHSGQNAPTCRNADSPYRADGTDFVLSVDGVLTSANVQVISVETIDTDFSYSDHDPVKMIFVLKDE